MEYIYNATAVFDGNGWFIEFPQFSECNTYANSRKEIAKMARDRLQLEISDYIEEDKKLPPQKNIVECLAVCVSLTNEDMDKMHYMTMQMAAEKLEVSVSRVSHLIKAGILERKIFDRRSMVSIESVNRYMNSSRQAGRPSKHNI